MSNPGRVTYDSSSEFQQALRRRVDRYFRMNGLSARDSTRMYVKSAVILAGFALLYVALVFFAAAWWHAVLLSVALGFGIAAIGFNIQHDGGHDAYSKHPSVNRIMSFTLDLMGASSYVWSRKHNIAHHTHTNVAGHDDDIDLGPLARFSPEQERFRHHRLQHVYMWILYAAIIPKWQFRDDFQQILAGRTGSSTLPWPRGWEMVRFLAGKLAFFSLAFVIPALIHPLWAVVGCYFLATGFAGIILSIVFQLAHVVEETHFPAPNPKTGRIESPWAVHQVQTTADFARDNRLLSWFVGGLNFQIEHHLFPRICHVHYPRIARIVEKTCRRHGIRYHSFPTMSSAVRSHYRWLRAMGRPGVTAAAG